MNNNKSILKTQQRFKKKCIMFLLKKLIRLLSVQMMIKVLVIEKEEIKCSNIIKR